MLGLFDLLCLFGLCLSAFMRVLMLCSLVLLVFVDLLFWDFVCGFCDSVGIIAYSVYITCCFVVCFMFGCFDFCLGL